MTRTSRGHGTLPQASSLGGVTKTWPGHGRDHGDITSQDRIRLRRDQTWPNDMEDSWPGSYLQLSRRADWHVTGTWPEKLTCITCDIHWLYISGLVKSAGNSFHRCPDVCQRRAIRAVPLVVHQRPQEIWQTTQRLQITWIDECSNQNTQLESGPRLIILFLLGIRATFDTPWNNVAVASRFGIDSSHQER